MKLRGLRDEDFLQYKKPAMFVIFPFCTFKCDKENGTQVCQNFGLSKQPIIEIEPRKLVERYLLNPLTKALVIGGLEPIDSYSDLLDLIREFRKYTPDDVVIYTGYNADEIDDELACLAQFKNIIVKFGRFIPGQTPHLDALLGVELASDNQYAERIS